jgi:hypothetical protein
VVLSPRASPLAKWKRSRAVLLPRAGAVGMCAAVERAACWGVWRISCMTVMHAHCCGVRGLLGRVARAGSGSHACGRRSQQRQSCMRQAQSGAPHRATVL